MKNIVSRMIILTMFIFAFFIDSEKIFAKEQQVKVTLPTFDITINGNVVDNESRKYPFLVYKGITYVPMTWYDSRVLGLETAWSHENGLEIKKEKVTSSYKAELLTKKNAKSYQAIIRQGTLKLNGKIIKNDKEDYPFLTFNQITYFPLTWRLAHDELGWGYEWSKQKGLSITSDNIKVKPIEIAQVKESNEIARFNNHIYYVETIGNDHLVYHKADNKNKSEIYQYHVNPDSYINTYVGFRINEQQLLMNYMTGYMSNYVSINKDGKHEGAYTKLRASVDFRDTAYGKLAVIIGLPDERNGNLHLIKEDGTTQQVGNPEVTTFGQSAIREGITPTVVDGKEVYVLLSRDYPSPYVLYRIDLTNKETTVIVENADWFVISNGKLYFINSNDKLLYKANKDGSEMTQLSDTTVTWFDVINDNIFYTSKNITGKLQLFKAKAEKDEQVLKDTIVSVKTANKQLLILLEQTSSYGAIILDGNGNVSWKVADQISKVYASDDGWLVQAKSDGEILLIR